MGPTPRTRRPLGTKIRDQELIEENKTVGNLATRLAKYLSPQIYQSIFSNEGKPLKNMLGKLDHLSLGHCQIYRPDRYPGT